MYGRVRVRWVLIAACAAMLPLTSCGTDDGRPNLANPFPAERPQIANPASPAPGRELWRRRLNLGADAVGGSISTPGHFFTATSMQSDGDLAATVAVGDARDGRILHVATYRFAMAQPLTSMLNRRLITVVVQATGDALPGSPTAWTRYEVTCFDAVTGKPLWHRDARFNLPGNRTMLKVDGITGNRVIGHVAPDKHASSGDEQLVALDASSGALVWRSDPAFDFDTVSTADGVVAVSYRRSRSPTDAADALRIMTARDGRATGDVAWDFPAGVHWRTVEVAARDRILLGGWNTGGPGLERTVGMANATGTIVWQRPACRFAVDNAQVRVAALLAQDGSYAGIDTITGRSRWVVSGERANAIAQTIVYGRGRWFTGNVGRSDVVLDALTGQVVLETKLVVLPADQWNGHELVWWADDATLAATAGPSSPIGLLRDDPAQPVLFLAS